MINKILIILTLVLSKEALAALPDKLAYLGYTGEYWQTFVIDATKMKSRQVTDTDFDISVISWLDGGKQLFIVGLQGEAGIIDISSGKFTTMKMPHIATNDAVITGDGKKIAYSVIPEKSSDNKLYYYDIEKKQSFPLYEKLRGRQYDPKWSRDGESIYFISGKSNAHYNIVKGGVKGERPTVVINNAYYNLDVDVSSSDAVAYSSNINGAFNIWINDGNVAKNITASDARTHLHPSWSSDGKRIYYESVIGGITSIWVTDLSLPQETSSSTQVTFNPDGSRYPTVYRGQ